MHSLKFKADGSFWLLLPSVTIRPNSLSETEAVIEGTYSGVLGTNKPVKGTYKDGKLSVFFSAEWPDGSPAEVKLTGTLSGDSGSGSVVVEDRTEGTWDARRVNPPQHTAPSGAPGAVSAGESEWSKFAGVWLAMDGAANVVENAIRQAVEPMGALTRGIARGRLLKTNAPPLRIRMFRQDASFVIEYEGRPALSLPISGAEVKQDDRTMRLEARASGVLRHTVETPEGRRENVYRLGPGADVMTLEVTVTSPRLPQPLQYAIEFRRSDLAAAKTGGAQ